MTRHSLPKYSCRKVRVPPALDGKMDSRPWERAEPIHLLSADTGRAPKQATEVRLLYDAQFLYAGFRCQDSDVWGSMTDRDSHIYREEVVELFIDPAGRRRSYFEFEVSPHNTVFDLFVLNDSRCGRPRVLKEWNCRGLRTATEIQFEMRDGRKAFKGWTCEMAIPFFQMCDAPNLPPRKGDIWPLNLYRIDRGPRDDEYSAWSPACGRNFHQPRVFGELVFA